MGFHQVLQGVIQMADEKQRDIHRDDGLVELLRSSPGSILVIGKDGREYVVTPEGNKLVLPFCPVPPGHPDF